jgi:hypothetical protein
MFVFAGKVLAASEVTITGSVHPVEWDDSDNVFAAAIATSRGDKYVIAKDSVGKSLFKLAYRKVEVIGVVRENTRGNKRLR